MLILFLILSILPGCVYYQDMPKEWVNEVVNIKNCQSFNGTYALDTDLEKSKESEPYNDLRYFQNTPLSGIFRVTLPQTTSVGIMFSEENVEVTLYSFKNNIYKENFSRESFNCNNGVLTLQFDTQKEIGSPVYIKSTRKLSLYKGNNNSIIVKSTHSEPGSICLIPVFFGGNDWFKLKTKRND